MNSRALKGAVPVVVAMILTISGCSGGDDDSDGREHGSDDHVVIDPVADDPAIAAKTVAINRYQWNPSIQSGVWALPLQIVENNLTGEALDKASSPADTADNPEEWSDWADAGATMRAIVTDPVVTGEGDTRTVTVTVRQDLEYPDGSGSEWRTQTVTVHLVNDGGHWKADRLSEGGK